MSERLTLTGGGDAGANFSYAQIGPLGISTTSGVSTITGNMFFPYIGIDLNLTGGVGTQGYAQLGPKTTDAAINSYLTITEIGQDLGMFAGFADNTYVQIGGMSNNMTAANTLDCNVTIVSVGNNLSLIANQNPSPPPANAFAQIGNRGVTPPTGTVRAPTVGATTKIISGPVSSNYAVIGNVTGSYIDP